MYPIEFLQIAVKVFSPKEIEAIQETLDISDPKFASILRVSLSSIEAYKTPATSKKHREPKGSTLVLLYWLNEIATTYGTWKRAYLRAGMASAPAVKESTVKKAVDAIRAKKNN
jgi:hypothetical protein